MTAEEQLSDCISGVSISQISAVSALLPDDTLLISEPCLDVRRPVNWRSKSMAFAQLSAKLMADISAAWKFGSMAWEDAEDYARWDHSHHCYNLVTGVSCFYEDDISGTVDLGTITVGSRTFHLRMPMPEVQKADSPVVGQLKFKATQESGGPIDWTADGFDGWVYPDGSAFPLSAFDIDGEFETEGDYFRVPVISDFMRLNPRPYESVSVESDYSDFVPAHTHTVDIALSGESPCHFKYRASNYGEGSYSHGVANQNMFFPYTLKFDAEGIEIADSGYVLSSDEVGTESAPSHTKVMTLIYIGTPKTGVV